MSTLPPEKEEGRLGGECRSESPTRVYNEQS